MRIDQRILQVIAGILVAFFVLESLLGSLLPAAFWRSAVETTLGVVLILVGAWLATMPGAGGGPSGLTINVNC